MFSETDVNECNDVDAQDDDDDMLEAREQSTPESDTTHSSVSNQSASKTGQSSTDGPRRSQRSRRPVIPFGQDDT